MHGVTDHVVVITGASSGVGRATAHAFARHGARLVLCARDPGPLRDAAHECRRLGADALPVAADTRDPRAMEDLAEQAVRAFGRLDVWVNNAGSGAVGRFWEVPLDAHIATIETDLLGYVHGAYAALRRFVPQRHGVLINNVSIGGFVPTPFAAAYSAAKFGVRGFSRALRQELRPYPDIQVCALYPSFIDTPGLQHGANYTGRHIGGAALALAPETVAERIVGLARRPRPELMVGQMARLGRLQHALMPGLVEWGLGRGIAAALSRARPAPIQQGRLERPDPAPMGLHGGMNRGLGTAGNAVALGLLAAAGLAAGVAMARRRGA